MSNLTSLESLFEIAASLAPTLWGSIAHRLTHNERIELAALICGEDWSDLWFHDRSSLYHSFMWASTKQGYAYWREIHQRLTGTD